MRIKLFAAGAAIALAATIGSASAADQFSTLEGIAAEAMAPRAMSEVKGASHSGVIVSPLGDPLVEVVFPESEGTDIFDGFPGPNIGRATSIGGVTPAALFCGLPGGITC